MRGVVVWGEYLLSVSYGWSLQSSTVQPKLGCARETQSSYLIYLALGVMLRREGVRR